MNSATLERLNLKLGALRFAPPVSHVYNPLEYAGAAYLEYCRRYGQGPKRVVLMGMNPGPWGMTQTGVPFGEVMHVRDWLGISAPIGVPSQMHPARPVTGLACQRSEVSGRRVWSFLKERYGNPENFFKQAFIANYCPLVFLEESGRNRTPDKLPKAERMPLLQACSEALVELLRELQPEMLVGVGKWAAEQGQAVVTGAGLPQKVTSIPHPSPANPAANSGWGRELGELLSSLGL